jgi:hypothetical protein
MTQLASDPSAKAARRRRQGRFVALLWACWWTFSLMALWAPFLRLGCGAWGSQFAANPIMEIVWLALLLCVPWITFALTWQHEAIGGLVLGIEGLLLTVVMLGAMGQAASALPFEREIVALPCVGTIAATLCLPPLGAGFLLLSACRGSRGAEVEVQDSQQGD